MATANLLTGLVEQLRRRCGDAPADGDLLAEFASNHDEAAFAELVGRHGGLVLGVARRHLPDRQAAEDVVQATFAALARSASRLGRPPSLVNWLYTVALRQARKTRLRFARRTALLRRVPLPLNPIDPLAEVSGRELATIIDDELARLPAMYRLPLLLCALEGMSREEAARRLGWPIGSVKGRLERGRELLRTRLAARGLTVPAALAGELVVTPSEAMPAALVEVVTRAAMAVSAATIPLKLIAVAGAVLLALGVGTGAALMSGVETQPKAPSLLNGSAALDRYGDPLPPNAVTRLGTLRYRAGDKISYLSVVPGGQQVAFRSDDAIEFMDLQTGKVVRQFNRWTRPVAGRERPIHFTTLAFSPDHRTFAVGSRDAEWTVKEPADMPPVPFWLCDAATGARLRMFEGHNQRLLGLAVLAGSQRVVSLAADGVVRVWDAATGAKVYELTGPGHKLTCLAASGDGKTIATGGAAKDGAAPIYLWDAASGKLLQTLAGHSADVKAVVFGPDGQTIASGGNATVRIWDVATGREMRQLHGHAKDRGKINFCIYSLAFSPDGRTIASASTDDTIRVSAVGTGRALDDMSLTAGEGALAFSDARSLLVGSGQTLLRRDVAGRASAAHDGPRWWMGFLSFTSDGRSVVTADPESTVRIWDSTDGRMLSVKTWNPLTVCTLVLSGGQRVAFSEGDADQAVTCIGDVASGRIIRRLPDKDQYPALVSADGQRLATLPVKGPENSKELALTVWDMPTWTKIGRLTVGEQTFALAADGRTLFTADWDQPYRLRQWEVATGRAMREYTLQKNVAPHGVSASPGGRRLAVVYHDKSIRIWDTATGKECWMSKVTDEGRDPDGESMTFSPDGSWLAIENLGNGKVSIEIWDPRTGKPVATLSGHRGGVVRMAFSPDGRRLASTSTDGTALVWDVEAATGRRVVSVLDPPRQAELWADLAGNNAAGAHSVDCLQAAPAAAVTILTQRLAPAIAVPSDRVAPLIAGLDNPAFAAREKAQRDLAAVGLGAEALVRAARDQANAEVRRRIDGVLNEWEGERRRALRATEVLEQIATPPAREHLKSLAGGAAGATLTRAAADALMRLDPR